MTKRRERTRKSVKGVALWAGIGMVFGAALGEVGVGMVLGAAVGVVVGTPFRGLRS